MTDDNEDAPAGPTAPTQDLVPIRMGTGGHLAPIIPKSVEDTFRIAKGVVQAGLAPYALIRGKNPNEAATAVAVVIMSGMELGLLPMVALRSFTVINGRPALYGDGLMAVIRRSGKMKVYTQRYDFTEQKAVVSATRADTGETMEYVFTKQEAIDADLWDDRPEVDKYDRSGNIEGKKPNDSPWFRYRSRMMIFRARTYLFRDLFADVLGGITDEYEASSIPEAAYYEEERRPRNEQAPAGPKAEDIDISEERKTEFVDNEGNVSRETSEEPVAEEDYQPSPEELLDKLDRWMEVKDDKAGVEEVWTDMKADEWPEDQRAHAEVVRAQHLARVTGNVIDRGAKAMPETAEVAAEAEPEDMFPGDTPMPDETKPKRRK